MIASFAALEIEGQNAQAAASLLGVKPVVLLAQEVLEGSQEERPELAAGRIGCLEIILFQQLREKLLRQILGILDTGQPSSGVCIERIPIDVTQGGQGLLRLRRRPMARGCNETPARRGEPPRRLRTGTIGLVVGRHDGGTLEENVTGNKYYTHMAITKSSR